MISKSRSSIAAIDDIVYLFGHPIPACRIVAVTLPPALLKAFTVSRIAATGVVKLP
jgi:hypothetical protein